MAEVAGGTEVAGAVDPFQAQAVSKDGRRRTRPSPTRCGPTTSPKPASRPCEKPSTRPGPPGLTVEVGGDALATQPAAGGPAEGIGVAVAAVVLLITFGSLAAAGLPLLVALLGVGISMAAITGAGRHVRAVRDDRHPGHDARPGLRHRLRPVHRLPLPGGTGRGPRTERGGRARVGTAGSAVVFAGLTVIIALAGLSVVGIPMLTKMGLAAAGAVAVAVLVALTLVPALLGFWPNAVLSRAAAGLANRRAKHVREEGGRWARFVLRYPVPVLLAGVVGLGAIALPGHGPAAGHARRRVQADLDHRAPRLRRAREGFGPASTAR